MSRPGGAVGQSCPDSTGYCAGAPDCFANAAFSISIEGSSTLGHFGSGRTRDFSAFAGGTLEFDILIESEPDDTEWLMLADCTHPCGTGPVPMSKSIEGKAPVVGNWQHYTFRVDDLVNREGSFLDGSHQGQFSAGRIPELDQPGRSGLSPR